MNTIPMVFHFAFFRGATNWPWLDFHTLCLKSCFVRAGAEKIVVHYDRDGEGEGWEEAKALQNIEWRQTMLDWKIHGSSITDQRIMCDYHRLQVLHTEGGFFCDLDFVFLKSFQKYRNYPAIIGTQCKQKKKLCCGLMGSIAGSTFIKAYLDEYEHWTPSEQKKVWTFANIIPWNLSEKYPVFVVPRVEFYPVCWSNKTFWAGRPHSLKSSHAVHLWETLHPELSVEVLMKTCLASEIESMDADQSKSTGVVTLRTGLLSFD
jgi:hypothetical protein